ncbi:MAG: sugar phosphate nucleotidyltransferase, partial [Lachnospiraceae bacterium]
MKKTALVILAAGIGSRFGTGIKQLEPVGPSGELIIDYSIHDALEAGFDKVVFIIRKSIDADFRAIIGDRISKICDVAYAYQEMEDLPEGFTVPEGRKKPWGTGQAVLSAKDVIDGPFCVINADDYYGKGAFQAVHDFLVNYDPSRPTDFCMAGFILGNTLSDHGSVTRGLCKVDEAGNLTEVVETHDIL